MDSPDQAQDRSMDENFVQKVRNRAYALWEREGRPDGRDDEFWLCAERDVRAEGASPEQDAGTAGSA